MTTNNVFKKDGGQSFLGIVILIGGIVITVGAILAFLASSLVDTTYGYKASAIAEATANAGVQDALLQLDRNSLVSFPSGYTLSTGNATATIFITQNSPSTGYITVLASSTVLSRIRKIDVVLTQNASTTAPTVVSWQEVQ